MDITVEHILAQLRRSFEPLSETALLDAQVLLAHQLAKSRSWVLAHPEAIVSDDQQSEIRQSALRLERGEPLPYVIGHWEFYNLDFLVSPGVLIPRPETELMVEAAIRWLEQHPHKRRLLDVGTGSGCIGIAIARHIPDVHVVLSDISPQALQVVVRNVEVYALQDRIKVIQADLLDGIEADFDLLCANLPYIPTQTLNTLPVAKREPILALDGGVSGTEVIQCLLHQAKSRLRPGSLLLLEMDPAQCERMGRLASELFPASSLRVLQDLAAMDRCMQIELSSLIYHLCPRPEWSASQALGEYSDPSLASEGFIHCSTSSQVVDVANRYYQGVPDMLLLSIDVEKLASPVRWEESGSEYYPHIYGPVNLDAVISASDFNPDPDGTYRAFPTQSNIPTPC